MRMQRRRTRQNTRGRIATGNNETVRCTHNAACSMTATVLQQRRWSVWSGGRTELVGLFNRLLGPLVLGRPVDHQPVEAWGSRGAQARVSGVEAVDADERRSSPRVGMRTVVPIPHTFWAAKRMRSKLTLEISPEALGQRTPRPCGPSGRSMRGGRRSLHRADGRKPELAPRTFTQEGTRNGDAHDHQTIDHRHDYSNRVVPVACGAAVGSAVDSTAQAGRLPVCRGPRAARVSDSERGDSEGTCIHIQSVT